jgi:hypothetical protein
MSWEISRFFSEQSSYGLLHFLWVYLRVHLCPGEKICGAVLSKLGLWKPKQIRTKGFPRNLKIGPNNFNCSYFQLLLGWSTIVCLGLPQFYLFIFLWCMGWPQSLTLARQAFYHLSRSASPVLCWVFFEIGFQELFAQSWLWTMILLSSASWVARITGVSHQHPAIPVLAWKIPSPGNPSVLGK